MKKKKKKQVKTKTMDTSSKGLKVGSELWQLWQIKKMARSIDALEEELNTVIFLSFTSTDGGHCVFYVLNLLCRRDLNAHYRGKSIKSIAKKHAVIYCDTPFDRIPPNTF